MKAAVNFKNELKSDVNLRLKSGPIIDFDFSDVPLDFLTFGYACILSLKAFAYLSSKVLSISAAKGIQDEAWQLRPYAKKNRIWLCDYESYK